LRPIMNPSRSEQARTPSLLLAIVLLGLVVFSHPIATKAADEGDPNTTGVVIPGPVLDTGLRVPSSGGPVVIRGTRPAPLPVAEPPSVRDQRPSPANTGWVPAPYYGSGWDTGYDWGGLSNTPTPNPR